ncbi:MAG TPA: DUF4199 domain-containing protein [Vicinamibacterales bacterium]|nr:DUF4199 domain-containing protein [Vicinamibacterales bacterium]
MNPILSAGLLIGVLCVAWTFVMGLTGWYKDPVLLNAFFLVIPIEMAGLFWGLRRTAAEGRGYGSQVIAGTMMAIVAGVIIMAGSLVFTMVAYPDYFRELEEAYRELARAQGRSEAEIAQSISDNMASATPMGQAMGGFLGTLITGIVASAVLALFVRSRHPIDPSAHAGS